MIDLNSTWQTDKDKKDWQELVKKTFANAAIKSLRDEFQYPVDCEWKVHSNLTKLNHVNTKLLVISNRLKISQLKFYNVQDVLTSKKIKDYLVKGDDYHVLGFDGHWEIVFLLKEVIELWQKNTLTPLIKINCAINENLFFNQVKLLSLKVLIKKILNILSCHSKVEITAITSDRMYSRIDYKNNVLRLTYAVMGAVLSGVDYLAVKPLPGFKENQGWKIACQTFNVIALESDTQMSLSPQVGAVFFENAISEFTQNIWNSLQEVLKMTDVKEFNKFKKNILDNTLDKQNVNLLQVKRKVVGVNDFIAPNAPMSTKTLNNEFHKLEEKRILYQRFSKRYLKKGGFYYFGEKSKLIKSLNSFYQFFALANIEVIWQNLENISAKDQYLVIVADEKLPDLLVNKIIKNKKIQYVFINSNTQIKDKRCFIIDLQQSPFVVWDQLLESK